MQIGSYLGLVYHRSQVKSNGELIAGLVEYCIKIKKPETNKKVRVDLLSKDDQEMLIIQNLENKSQLVQINLSGIKAKAFTEQFTGKKVKLQKEEGKYQLNIKLDAREVQVYLA